MNKIHSRGKIILYALSGMGVNMLNLMMGSYLCSALLVGGFGAEAVPFQTFAQRDLVIAAVWAVFVLIAKILDGIIDIPMASFTDNLRTRWGRRRPALLIGFIPMIAAYLLFLLIPQNGATLVNTIYFGVVLCLFYTAYTLTMVTYYATFTEIVDTVQERNLMSHAKSVYDIVYFILGYVVVRMLLNGMNIRLVALIVLPIALTMMIPMFMIKEKDLRGVAGEKTEKISLFRSLALTFKNKTFILWMIAYAFMTFGVQLFLGGINEYFSFVKMNMMFIMMASFAPVPLTLLLYNKIQKKYGFAVSFRYSLIMFSVGMLAMFGVSLLNPETHGTLRMVLSIVTGLISSFAIGALFSVAYSIPSQLAADEEAKTGVANPAMYFAVQGLWSGVATGIATGVVLVALKGTESAASDAIRYLTVICAGGTLVSCLLTFLLPASLKKLGRQEKKSKENIGA